ncbi:MAG: hypothetical protein LBN10_09860 [Propionibacteriaceae bacterium]|jgi:hypothetical protein|nr:hypothetical protein [Propionibacteriaceae bacterium]
MSRSRTWVIPIVLLVGVAVVAAVAAYNFRDRIHFGTDSRTVDRVYVSYNDGSANCESYPFYRIDLTDATFWDGTCPDGEWRHIDVDTSAGSSAETEGFLYGRALSDDEVAAFRAALQGAHVNAWKPQYGNCQDGGGWRMEFVYTNGDVESTGVEYCSTNEHPHSDYEPPNSATVHAAIRAITGP